MSLQEQKGATLEGSLTLRRRSVWEAADAGLLLWRTHGFALIPFFVLPLGFMALGSRLLPPFMRYWSYLLLWWLKPLFDRLILQVLGIRFFEPEGNLSRLTKGLSRTLMRGLAGDLLWRRFSPWRAATMPIRVLEGLKAAQVRQRKRVLENGGLGFCLLITILCFILEKVLLAGELLCAITIIELFRPDYSSFLWNFSSISQVLPEVERFIFGAYCFSYGLMESLYVCMSFGLYINSRIEIEGWDLELLFRNFIKVSS